jgi:hypothetical protein
MGEIFTLAPSNGVPYYLVIAVIGGVNLVRWLLYRSNKPWTTKIGGKWVWMTLAAAISIAICVGFKINIIRDIPSAPQSIGSLQFVGYVGYIASGIALSLSSNLATFIASIPQKMQIKDLKAGTLEPGTILTSEEHWSTPPIPVEEVAPIPVSYKTILLTPWIKESPDYLMLERSDGVKRILKLSNDELKSVEEAWSKISNLEV